MFLTEDTWQMVDKNQANGPVNNSEISPLVIFILKYTFSKYQSTLDIRVYTKCIKNNILEKTMGSLPTPSIFFPGDPAPSEQIRKQKQTISKNRIKTKAPNKNIPEQPVANF